MDSKLLIAKLNENKDNPDFVDSFVYSNSFDNYLSLEHLKGIDKAIKIVKTELLEYNLEDGYVVHGYYIVHVSDKKTITLCIEISYSLNDGNSIVDIYEVFPYKVSEIKFSKVKQLKNIKNEH